jgi:hypothetical protein
LITPGYKEFRPKDLLKLLSSLCSKGQARETILILDTLKKFTDLMDKRMASDFGNSFREFIAKGGTAICLAHTNKNRNHDGKLVPAGTSDVPDDADTVYVLDPISDDKGVRTVEFENIKRRGMVSRFATYQYSSAEDVSYLDLLASVTPVDDTKAGALRDAAARLDHRDIPIIQAIVDCISSGVTAKTKIIDKAASITGDSKRHAERVLDKYTGTDPNLHHWNYAIGDRGVHSFELLPTPDDVPDIEDLL